MTLVDSEDFDGRQAVDGEVERLYRLEQAACTRYVHTVTQIYFNSGVH